MEVKSNGSTKMSSGDLPANEVISPKIEFEVEEDAKEAYYRAHCSSPPPQQENPIPKRRLRPQGAPFMPSMVLPEYLTNLRNFYQI